MYTKEQIKHNLQFDLKWMERALVVLFLRQTEEEKNVGETITENGRGFNSSDARYLNYCSKWIMKGNHLNAKHAEKCGKKLPKYWKQIQEMIKEEK